MKKISAHGGHEVGDRTWCKCWMSKAYLKMFPEWSTLSLAKVAGLGQVGMFCWKIHRRIKRSDGCALGFSKRFMQLLSQQSHCIYQQAHFVPDFVISTECDTFQHSFLFTPHFFLIRIFSSLNFGDYPTSPSPPGLILFLVVVFIPLTLPTVLPLHICLA